MSSDRIIGPNDVILPESIDLTPTFFVSSSSDLRQTARRIAGRFKELGHKWEGDFDWTNHYHPDERGARLDIDGACNAETYVLFLRLGWPTCGGWVELGARLAVDRVAHVILNDFPVKKVIFFRHPLVHLYKDETEFWFIRENCLEEETNG